MNLRRLGAAAALTTIALTVGSLATAGAAPAELGEFSVGETISFPYGPCEGAANDNSFMLEYEGDFLSIDKEVDNDSLLGYMLDTSDFQPGNYYAEITCNGGENDGALYNYSFSLVPADPCAPVESIVTPKGPGRAPHGAPIDCEGSGLPDSGSESTTVLVFGSLAIVAGTGLLIARRRTLA